MRGHSRPLRLPECAYSLGVITSEGSPASMRAGLRRAALGFLGGLFQTPLYHLGGSFQTPLYHLRPCRRTSL